MIKHIVMWRVRGDTDIDKRANIERVCSGFNALKGHIPGMLQFQYQYDTQCWVT